MQETQTTQKSSNRLVIGLLAVIIVLLGAVVGVLLTRDGGDNSGPAQSANPSLGLQYASEGVAALDQGTLQDAIDEMARKAREGTMALDYKNLAVSTDGKVFTCYLGNSNRNSYDMYIDIYADTALTDQVFLSGLIRPGEKFESIELNRVLEPGTHQLYCAFTQVEKDLSAIHAQIIVTITFEVRG